MKYICPALGGVDPNDPTNLCAPKRSPENICCASCGMSTPNRKEGQEICPDECMKIAYGQESCGTPM